MAKFSFRSVIKRIIKATKGKSKQKTHRSLGEFFELHSYKKCNLIIVVFGDICKSSGGEAKS